ncbi:MAG: AtpZ/AtpI family protein [Acidimicrobiales bacterium]
MTSDELKAQQELYNGFGDTMSRGVELVLVPVLFGLFGYVVDRALGIVPVGTIVLALIGVVGVAIRSYYAYKAKMDEYEATGPWARRV